MKTFAWVPILSLCLIGCGNTDNNGDAGMDLGVALDGGDMATGGGDMSGLQCAATDPMGDGADCSSTFSCPSGQICVKDAPTGTAYHCKYKCNDSAGTVIPALCPCDRACLTLTNTDGGVVGAGCILGNTAGERCGVSGGVPIFGQGACAQQTFCAGPTANSAYCLWTCTPGGNECPAATTCSPIMNSPTGDMGSMIIGYACTYNYGSSGIVGGATCSALTDTCMAGFLCDGTKCQTQCDGLGGTCGVGTCTAVNDPAKNKVIGYVCK